MPEFVCPGCQAEIERDLIEKTGRAECPFCGGDLASIGLPEPTGWDETAGVNDSDTLESPHPSPSGEASRPIPAVPEKSRIRIVESTPERMVLFIPGGGKQTSGLGCFALMWNGFLCIFTPAMTAGLFKDGAGNAPPLLFMIPFLSLFWAVGLGFAWFWLKFKYERTFILLDRDRIVLQKIMFNRKRLDETALGPDSRASLVESYQQNEVPVYRVEVGGAAKAAKFGTALANEEKDWLVDRINEFLGVPSEKDDDESDEDAPEETASQAVSLTFPNACEKCGAPLTGAVENGILTCAHCGSIRRGTAPSPPAQTSKPTQAERFERLTSDQLPPDSGIRIVTSSPDRLVFRLARSSSSPLRWIVPLFSLPFAIAWYGFIFSFIRTAIQAPFGGFSLFMMVFMIPFVAAGLMPLGIGLFALAGNTTVTVTRERVSCSWGVGPIGYTRHILTESIDSVRLENVSDTKRNRRVRESSRVGTNAGIGESRPCVVRAGEKMLPLTMFEDATCARQVASLVRTRLEELGHPLSDA